MGTLMTKRMTGMAVLLRIFCAVLLLSLGFAHERLYAEPAFDPASSHYLLPDGTFAGLCIGDVHHGKPHKSRPGSGCDACRLGSAILLPPPTPDHAAAFRNCHGAVFAIRIAFPGTMSPRPGSPVRGPPSLSA